MEVVWIRIGVPAGKCKNVLQCGKRHKPIINICSGTLSEREAARDEKKRNKNSKRSDLTLPPTHQLLCEEGRQQHHYVLADIDLLHSLFLAKFFSTTSLLYSINPPTTANEIN